MRKLKAVAMLAVVLALPAARDAVAAPQDPEKPAAAAAPTPPPVKTDYSGGFRMTSGDGRYSLRIMGGAQMRYSYVRYDARIEGNSEDYSNFFLRRARVWFDGHAFGPRLTYLFQVQLEPQVAVNLYDAWINYAFHPLFQVGAGRNKISYGLEYMVSAFSGNFIDRSILSGETDISSGGGISRWPGGGTAFFATSAEDPNTGFPVGGLVLFRSQGVQVSGRGGGKGPAFEYQGGIWQGRNTRGASNAATDHLFSIRAGLYPNGQVNVLSGGDIANTPSLKTGIIASAYADTTKRKANFSGASASPYDASDSGFNLALLARFRGFSADVEWAVEHFELEDRSLVGDREFDREGWRVAGGYFVRPRTVEVVARHAQTERLKDPTYSAVRNSGLGFASVNEGGRTVQAAERKLTETTVGLNYYLPGNAHQHKIFLDYSRLTRSFAGSVSGTTLTGSVTGQLDHRVRALLQIRF